MATRKTKMAAKAAKQEDPRVVEARETAQALTVQTREPINKWLAVKKIANKEQVTEASSIVAWAKEFKAKADAKRKEYVTPLNNLVKKINADFKDTTEPVDKILSHVQSLMVTYTNALRAKEEKKIEVEAKAAEERGEAEFAQDLRDNAIRNKPDLKLDGLHQRDVWSAKVTDLGAAIVAFMEGNAQLASAKEDIVAALEKATSKIAAAVKREDIGVPGISGVRETTFVRRG